MIRIQHLVVRKSGKVICQIGDLRVAAGQHVVIGGANGSGKSTLLRVLAGLEKNFEGQAAVDVGHLDRVYVHQDPFLFRGTVLSNVLSGLHFRRHTRAQARTIAEPWLQRLGLADMVERKSAHLSGGERRRVALARAMVLQPPLLLLDEPLAEMDNLGVQTLRESLSHLADSTVVIASPNKLPDGFGDPIFELTCSRPSTFP